MRGAAVRNVAVIGIGIGILAVLLFRATTLDLRPPSVTSYGLSQETGGADRRALTSTSIEVNFSEPVDRASAEAAFAIEPPVAGSFSWSGSLMTFSPAERLPLDTEFAVSVRAGIHDAAGNEMSVDAEPFTFATVGRPSVVGSRPDGDDGPVPVDAEIEITFSTLMDTPSVEGALELRPRVDHRLRWRGETLAIVPSRPLEPGTSYAVTVGAEARDLAGNRLAAAFELGFATVAGQLLPTTLVPADGVTGAAAHGPIAVAFDEPIDPASLDGAFAIEPEVAGSLEVADPEGGGAAGVSAGSVVRFQPAAPLPANTTFTVTLGAGVRGLADGSLAEPLEWTFTTGAGGGSLRNQVVFLSARGGVRNLWAMNADGGNQRQLSAELAPVSGYAISPDGTRFAIGDGARLVEYDADGGGRRVLTEPGVVEFDPTYSADGSRLAFGRADAESGTGLGLWWRAAGGGDVVPIDLPGSDGEPETPPGATSAFGEGLLRAPRFAPDGERLAYVDASGRVVIVDLETRAVTEAAFHALGPPAWTAGGDSVVVPGVPAVDRRGSAPRVRPPVAPLEDAPPEDPGELALVRLEFGRDRLEPVAGGEGATDPAVGPADRLAFIRAEAGSPPAGRAEVREPGGGGRRLFDDDLRETGLAFSPESGWIIVARVRLAGEEVRPAGLWRVRLDGSEAVRLSPDGDTPGVAP